MNILDEIGYKADHVAGEHTCKVLSIDWQYAKSRAYNANPRMVLECLICKGIIRCSNHKLVAEAAKNVYHGGLIKVKDKDIQEPNLDSKFLAKWGIWDECS